ncbi:hypothetical protein ACSV5M_16910 [Cellvibrio sp. ARAG 10.3]|uniref:hypothetical protein n=1 Tax=Cellvibrio sp. ARAG 10.3 TaxID=3451358 RepID=UPI003F4827FF
MKTANEQPILVAGQLTDTSAVRAKVEQDIAFLTGRITNMEQHPRPNKIVLETYQGMLKSRIAVLKWLMHGQDEDDAGASFISQRSA